MALSITYRVIFITKDPYHPGLYPTKDVATGEIMGDIDARRTDGRGLLVEKIFDFLKGNITFKDNKEYGRLGQNSTTKIGKKMHTANGKGLSGSRSRPGERSSQQLDDTDFELDGVELSDIRISGQGSVHNDDDDESDMDFGQGPETFGFGDGADDSDLSDLESGVGFEGSHTPLFAAAQGGHSTIVSLLLALPGIDVNKANNDGLTPLYIATQNRHSAVLSLLLAVPGIDVNEANNDGATPFHIAVQNGHSAVVSLLLAVPGIDVNKSLNRGYTPLCIAARKGHSDIVSLLLKISGIDVNKADPIFF